MHGKYFSRLCLIAFVSLVVAQGAAAQQLVLTKEFTEITPIFLSGHEGDFSMITGFNYAGDILLDGAKVGTVSGEGMLLNPPLDLNERYDSGFLTIVNTVPGIGSFQVVGQFLSLGTSTSSETGMAELSWNGSICNGTGNLENMYGLSVGTGSVNLYSGAGNVTEIIRFRFGY